MTGLGGLSGAMQREVPPQPLENAPPKRLFAFPGNMAVGLVQSGHEGLESGWHQNHVWSAQPTRKPPQLEGINSAFFAHSHAQWLESRNKLMAEAEALKTSYKFRNESAITRFCLTHRTAIAVLSNAASELKRSFGEDAVLDLEAMIEDDDSTSIYAIVVWRGQVERAEAALDDFDERWWLKQAGQAGLTFTYELA